MQLPVLSLPIVSDRLLLRRTLCFEADTYYELHTDNDYITYIGEPISRERFDAQFAKELSDAPTGLSLAVTLRNSGAVIGELMLLPSTDHEVELIIALLPRYRGEGYAFEAAKTAVTAIFADTQISAVIACVEDAHVASLHMVEALGMTFMGRTERLGGKKPKVFSIKRPAPSV
jgi:RimJ/RimL family protein N-acetyltransferase